MTLQIFPTKLAKILKHNLLTLNLNLFKLAPNFPSLIKIYGHLQYNFNITAINCGNPKTY